MASYITFTTVVTAWRTKIRRKLNNAEQEASGVLMDSLVNAEAVRLFTNEAYELSQYEKAQREYENLNVKVIESLSFLNFGQQAIFTAGLLASMCITASHVAAGVVPLGDLVLVNSLLFQLAIPLNFIGSVYRETRLNIVDMQKLHELLHSVPNCRDVENAEPFELKEGRIRFEDVSFEYPSAEDGTSSIFRGISLEVPPGSMVGVVGASGSGKSTLIRLLLRQFDPSNGQITIDGQDLRHLQRASFRKHIGVVPQDVVLFNNTVFYNLQYGRPEASINDVINAAKAAHIHDTIEALPQGYNSPVGERGLKLSGGEKQRIGIARCILRDPRIVIFDEATSSLDVDTEGKILQAIKNMSQKRTCVAIAHRLSTIRSSDCIVVLDKGVIVEQGLHEDLLGKTGGHYARLWAMQMQSS